MFTNKTIKRAISLWRADEEKARELYQDISVWDVSEVTTMHGLFHETLDLPKIYRLGILRG